MNEVRKHYPFLNALRGVSCLWVLYHHAHHFFNMGSWDFGYLNYLGHNLAFSGFLGVDMFFVISGFLITGLLIDEYYSGQIRIGRFYARRFFKIGPHYFFILIIGMSILSIINLNYSVVLQQVLGYLLFFSNYLTQYIMIFAHTWSIAIEEQFYVTYPILLFLLAKFFKTRSDRFNAAIIMFLFLIVIGNMLRFACSIGKFPPAEGYVAWYQQTHVRFDALVFGCLIRFFEPFLVKKRFLVGGGSLVCAIFLYSMLLFDFKHDVWFFYTLAYLAAGLIIIAALSGFKPMDDLGKNRFLCWIGKNSYGIYLWHYILISPLIFFIKDFEWHLVLMYFALSITLGTLTTLTLERCFLNFRNRWIP